MAEEQDDKKTQENGSIPINVQVAMPEPQGEGGGTQSPDNSSGVLEASPEGSAAHPAASVTEEKDQVYQRLLRTAADFENYKKRSKKELQESVKRAEERVVLDFLGIVDNLERALQHIGEENQGIFEGVNMVLKQFLTTLEKYNIQPFNSIGQPFDPERHEAVQQLASDFPAQSVCLEFQKGYLRGERLVRPAIVAVSLGKAGSLGKPEGDENKPEAVGPSNGKKDDMPDTGTA